MRFLLTTALIACLSLWGSAAKPFRGLQKYEKSYLVGEKEHAKGSGELTISSTCLRPKGNRERPYPQKGDRLVVNPPTFTWPMADYKFPETFPVPPTDKMFGDYLTYDFQLCTSPDFSGETLVSREKLPLAMCNVHTPLAPGKWYWRYRVSGQDWSAAQQVTVKANVPQFASPTAAEAAAMLPSSHPFIFKPLEAASKPANRDRRQLVKSLLKKADKAVKKSISDYDVQGQEIPATASESERSQIEKFRLRYRIEPMCRDIASLLTAYRLDPKPEYLQHAIMLGDHVAGHDAEKMYAMSDFSGARSMSALAELIDVAGDGIGKERLEQYRDFIAKVGRRIMATVMTENVGSADGILYAHFFQHTFNNIFTTSIIMLPHLPEAAKWFDALYDIWLSRSPGGGFLADGVWPNGNVGYIHVNMASMVENYLLYRNLFGVNLFEHPWYSNCADALAMVVPAGSAGDGFGDDSGQIPVKNSLRQDFAYILGNELGNPFAIDYARRLAGTPAGQPYMFTKDNFMEYRLENDTPGRGKRPYAGEVPTAAVFPETGIATMHTNLNDTASNLFLAFRSSPFGVGSHGMAEQNSFNLCYGGMPIFYPTGYKITTTDKHYLLAHKNSRARNTITVDGKTQAYSHSAYGWIPRFVNGQDITYALGDASHAYVPFDISALNWETVLRDADAYTSEMGFIIKDEDNPQVKKFRRHIAMLRPGIIVIYDDLEADKDVTWTLRLNGLERSNMSLDARHNILTATTDNATAVATVAGSQPIRSALADTSIVKPFDWLNPQRGRPAKTFEAHQYHSTFENTEKCRRMRFLTIINVNNAPDDYTIVAELDPSKEARLEIVNKNTGESLLAGPTEKSDYAAARRYPLSTVLRMPDGTIKETTDRLPLMALPE